MEDPNQGNEHISETLIENKLDFGSYCFLLA